MAGSRSSMRSTRRRRSMLYRVWIGSYRPASTCAARTARARHGNGHINLGALAEGPGQGHINRALGRKAPCCGLSARHGAPAALEPGPPPRDQQCVLAKEERAATATTADAHPPLDVFLCPLAVAQEGWAQRAQLVQDAPEGKDVWQGGVGEEAARRVSRAAEHSRRARERLPPPRHAVQVSAQAARAACSGRCPCSGMRSFNPASPPPPGLEGPSPSPTGTVAVCLAVPHLRSHVVRRADLHGNQMHGAGLHDGAAAVQTDKQRASRGCCRAAAAAGFAAAAAAPARHAQVPNATTARRTQRAQRSAPARL